MNIFHHVYRASLKQNCKVIIIFLTQFTRCLILASYAKKLTNPYRNFSASRPPFSTHPSCFFLVCPKALAICFSRCCCCIYKAGVLSACSEVSPRQSRCQDFLLTIPFHPFYKLGLSCSIHQGKRSQVKRGHPSCYLRCSSCLPLIPCTIPEASPFIPRWLQFLDVGRTGQVWDMSTGPPFPDQASPLHRAMRTPGEDPCVSDS